MLKINAARLNAELETLAGFSESTLPAITRVLYSAEDLAARAWFKQRVLEAGLSWREDAIGNTFIRLEGEHANMPAVGTGSHIDAIPHSGRFDGTVGVLGGLEALRSIREAGITPPRSLEVVLFTAEEPTRFGMGCLGSRAMSGAFTADDLRGIRDTSGQDLEWWRAQAGFAGALETIQLPPDQYVGFVELHIEQGPLLEREGAAIGLVTAIAAPASFFVHLEGEGGHAGARLMPGRRDALLAAAEIALAVEKAALNAGAIDAVGTTGILEVHPGAINSIPGRARLGVDMRDIDGPRRDRAVAEVLEAIEEIAARRQVTARVEMLNADPPAASSELVLHAARTACAALGVSPKEMVSRAYHDTLFMARLCPTAMIFIACRDGVSHRPDEFAKPEDIALGVEVLAHTMLNLAVVSKSRARR